jgi:para-nitrobenzyl esterase
VDEDCLSLNVWAPSDASSLPVLVWVHGGALTIGAGSEPIYDGSLLAAEQGVVVITINYRLGALGGFVPLGGAMPGTMRNLGLSDVVLALEWVRDNVEAFGGDPSCVTLAGHSAGGVVVGGVLAMPAARGLVHRAILQSPGPLAAFTDEDASPVAEAFLGALDHPAELSTVDPAALVAAARALGPLMLGPVGIPVGASIDAATLPRQPLEAIADGAIPDVALLTGTVTHEMQLMLAPTGILEGGDAALLELVDGLTTAAGGPQQLRTQLLSAYSEDATRALLPAPPRPPEFLIDDRLIRMGTIRLLEAQASHQANIFSYQLEWQTPLGGGACHGIELPLLFGHTTLGDIPQLLGIGEHVEVLAREVRTRWCNFARTGDPNGTQMNGWPPYDAETRYALVLGRHTRVVSDPWGDQRAAWDALRSPGAPASAWDALRSPGAPASSWDASA